MNTHISFSCTLKTLYILHFTNIHFVSSFLTEHKTIKIIHRQNLKKTDKDTDGLTDIHIYRQTDKRTDRQTE